MTEREQKRAVSSSPLVLAVLKIFGGEIDLITVATDATESENSP